MDYTRKKKKAYCSMIGKLNSKREVVPANIDWDALEKFDLPTGSTMSLRNAKKKSIAGCGGWDTNTKFGGSATMWTIMRSQRTRSIGKLSSKGI
mmetsp:Transcript_2527/g.6025  ORF Transcript_2527/g.6025 Transcript_2527/m.6025 type:complete len:94 (+) Transcript_2527:393-674(+)